MRRDERGDLLVSAEEMFVLRGPACARRRTRSTLDLTKGQNVPVTAAEIFDGRTRLAFAEPAGPGKIVDYLTVRVEGPDLSASRQVYAGWAEGFAGLDTLGGQSS